MSVVLSTVGTLRVSCTLTDRPDPIQLCLDLNSTAVRLPSCLSSFSDNSDLIACMVVSKDGGQAQRFLAVDVYQMSLVEPETKRLGWGVVKFAGLLQVREKWCVHVCVDVSLW